MKVLVTGASGYIGRHVVTELLNAGNEVIASDLAFDGVDTRATLLEYEIFSRDSNVFSIIGEPDLLIHLAWKHGFIHNSSAHMEQLSDHFIFLRNMINGGCKNIAVMGSMHEIGYYEGKIDENTPCNPLSQYGIAKNALRQSLVLMQAETEYNLYWLRAFYIYGDDLKGSSIFSKIAQAEAEGKEFFPFTSGANKYDFISVSDLASQIVKASSQDIITGIINTCSGTPISLADQVEAYIAERGYKIRLNYGAFPDRQYDSPEVWGDPTKINTILNFSG